jgi:hypothetical protein
MNFYSKKIVELKNADVHIHYANNRGRGKDNVTLTFVPSGTPRNRNSKYNEFLLQYRVSGWAGIVNIPTSDIEYYGGLK